MEDGKHFLSLACGVRKCDMRVMLEAFHGAKVISLNNLLHSEIMYFLFWGVYMFFLCDTMSIDFFKNVTYY